MTHLHETAYITFLFYSFRIVFRVVFVYLLANLLVAVILSVIGIRSRKGIRRFILMKRWSSLLLLLTILFGHMVQGYFQSLTEWSPYNIDKSDIIGTWRKGRQELKFSEEGTVVYSGDLNQAKEGAQKEEKYLWNLSDLDGCSLYIKSEDWVHFAEWRIVIFNNEYRILDEYIKDEPLLIDLGFSKKKEEQ